MKSLVNLPLVLVLCSLLSLPSSANAVSSPMLIFADAGPRLGFYSCNSIDLGDVDGDGDLDVGMGVLGVKDRILINDGTGNLRDSGQAIGLSSNQENAQFFDMDGDGDLDFLTASSTDVAISYNDGTGGFHHIKLLSRPPIWPSYRYFLEAFVADDFDSDGDGDIVVGTPDGGVYFENIGEMFYEAHYLPEIVTATEQSISSADIDGDGDIDLSVSNSIFFYDGSGQFIDSGQNLGMRRGWGRSFGDLDGDGDLDLAIANVHGPDWILYNDGSGYFENLGERLLPGFSFSIAISDIDLDSDLDLVANGLSKANVYLNNGDGSFGTSVQKLPAQHSYVIRAGDLNGDNLADLAQCRLFSGSHVFLNVLPLPARIDCDPDTLSSRSRGKWLSCYVELPQGHDPREIDLSSILLKDGIAPVLDESYGFVRSQDSYISDQDADGIEERIVKFDRGEVMSALHAGDRVELVIKGALFSGVLFKGSDYVKVVAK
ncbi:MAG: FG-GAP repeat domain-containing protein [Thermoplasmata archaeon]